MAIQVSIFKKRNITDQACYWLIAFLSHVRKIMSSAVASAIRKQYNFNQNQQGFREGVETDTAITRHINNAQPMRSTPIIDLKAAYNSVPRKKLYRTIQERLDRAATDMVSSGLQPVTIETRGDTTGKRGTISKDVCQGWPLSPTIFNMYIDKLIQRVTAHVNQGSKPRSKKREWNITLFADDVKA